MDYSIASVPLSELGPFTPLFPASVSPPHLGPGGPHLLGGESVGGPNADEGTDTLVPNVIRLRSCYNVHNPAIFRIRNLHLQKCNTLILIYSPLGAILFSSNSHIYFVVCSVVDPVPDWIRIQEGKNGPEK
jgi:hypothetical protein